PVDRVRARQHRRVLRDPVHGALSAATVRVQRRRAALDVARLVLLLRRERHRPVSAVHAQGGRVPGHVRGRVPGAALARASARQVVAARAPAVPDRRDLHRRRRLRARPAARPVRGGGAPVHRPLPALDLRLRARAEPLDVARCGVRGADDRPLPALPARPGPDRALAAPWSHGGRSVKDAATVEGGRHEDPLALDAETMRELGYRTIDLLVERLQRDEPPIRRASPAEMRDRLHGPAPDAAQPFEEILAGLDRDVLPFASRDGHPGFFGFIPFAGTWPGALGDLIASACNLYAGSWMESAGVSQVELEVLGWFKEWIGFPADAAGSLVSGGSAANLTALACARETLAGPMRDELVLYVSDQAHSSIALPARAGPRAAERRCLPARAAHGERGDGRGSGPRPEAVRGRRSGRHDQYRR